MKKPSMFAVSVALFIIGTVAVMASMVLSGFDQITIPVILCQVVCVLCLFGLLAIRLGKVQSEPDEEDGGEFIFDEDDEYVKASEEFEENEAEETPIIEDEVEMAEEVDALSEHSIDTEINVPDKFDQEETEDSFLHLEVQQEEPALYEEPPEEENNMDAYDIPLFQYDSEEINTEEKQRVFKIQRLRRVKNCSRELPREIKLEKTGTIL